MAALASAKARTTATVTAMLASLLYSANLDLQVHHVHDRIYAYVLEGIATVVLDLSIICGKPGKEAA
jgi:hypothetical protein